MNETSNTNAQLAFGSHGTFRTRRSWIRSAAGGHREHQTALAAGQVGFLDAGAAWRIRPHRASDAPVVRALGRSALINENEEDASCLCSVSSSTPANVASSNGGPPVLSVPTSAPAAAGNSNPSAAGFSNMARMVSVAELTIDQIRYARHDPWAGPVSEHLWTTLQFFRDAP